MLKIPKKVNIFGKSHKIILAKNLMLPTGEFVLGSFTSHPPEIHLSTTLNENTEEMMATILHEMGHALINRISLNQTGMSPEIEEIIVDTYSKMITENFQLKFK